MKSRRTTFEHALYTLAFLLALGLRFYRLGDAPLTDAEAQWALQALQIARGGLFREALGLGPHPAYLLLTGATFSVVEASNFLARFWPALAGSLLALLPITLRRPLGGATAVVMAFGLALDPGLVAISRTVGGPVMALSFGLLALGLWYARRPVLAGLSSGMALLSGPQILMGILILLFTLLVIYLLGARAEAPEEEEQSGPGGFSAWLNPAANRLALFSAGVVVLLVGTLFLTQPQGLAAWFESLPAFLIGWVRASGIPALRLVIALLVDEPLVLIFAGVGLARGISYRPAWLEADGRSNPATTAWFLLLAAAVALALALLYPGRQVADLGWTLVPLWGLAALGLAPEFRWGEDRVISFMQAALVVVLLALFWLNLAALTTGLNGGAAATMRVGILTGILGLIVVTTFLFSMGWSWEAARQGLAWGGSFALTLYLVFVLWRATQLAPNQPQELWKSPPGTGQTALMMQTLHDLSEWNTGLKNQIEVVSTVDSPSLAWLLRNFPKASFSAGLPQSQTPPILITGENESSPALTAGYRGQDFVWWVRPGWAGAIPPDTLNWFAFRTAPLQEEHVILWAREDLFPGGASGTQTGATGQP
jgi:hypothetical protein